MIGRVRGIGMLVVVGLLWPAGAGAQAPVDLNNAGAAALQTLPGIGEAMARRIIEARPFADLEDLKRVKGIGERTFDKLLPLVTVGKLSPEAAAAAKGAREEAEKAQPEGGGPPVDINAATEDELTKLPGVGKATARYIVEHRQAHGPFASVDDLTRVKGLGRAKVDKLRSRATAGKGKP